MPGILPFKVQNFLVHFWQGMPSHMLEVLGCSDVVNLIGICDGILYKVRSHGNMSNHDNGEMPW